MMTIEIGPFLTKICQNSVILGLKRLKITVYWDFRRNYVLTFIYFYIQVNCQYSWVEKSVVAMLKFILAFFRLLGNSLFWWLKFVFWPFSEKNNCKSRDLVRQLPHSELFCQYSILILHIMIFKNV